MSAPVLMTVCLLIIGGVVGQEIGHTSAGDDPFTGELPHSAVLDSNDKFHLSWDFNKSHIVFEVTAQTLGYVGLGISPDGNMPGSDIVLGWVDSDLNTHLSNRFARWNSEPMVDKVQNLTLIWGWENGTHTVIRFMRQRMNCTPDDLSITWGPVHVIWAYNDEDPVENKAKYHAQRGSKTLFLLDPMRHQPDIPDNATTFDVRNRNFEIPTDEAIVHCESFAVPALDTKNHVIKIEPLITPGMENDVLAMVLQGCNSPVPTTSIGVSHKCFDAGMPADWWDCSVQLFVWSYGAGPFYFPQHVGLPLGGDNGTTMFLLETHYNNSNMMPGKRDSSGLRLTMTSKLRTHDAGMMTVGHVPSNTQIIPPYADSFRLDGHCSRECLSQAMGSLSKIKVVSVMFLMYSTGFKINLRHFRDGREAKPIAKNDNYDMRYDSLRQLEREVDIRSGDDLMTQCYYNTEDRTNVTWGGPDIRKNELCTSVIMYYPKIKLSHCLSSPHSPYLASFIGATLDPVKFEIITEPPRLAGEHWTKIIVDEIDWKEEKTRDKFQEFVTAPHQWGHYGLCRDGSTKQSSDTQVTVIPAILSKYHETPPMCMMTSDGSSLRLAVPFVVVMLTMIVNAAI